MVLWTGDSISHDLQNISPTDVLDSISALTSLIANHFPNIPVIPALGNHDFHPPNYQSFNVSFSSHLEEIASLWKVWLDGPEIEKFKEFGYFRKDFPESLQSKSPTQKVSTIVMNT